jgi:hypothetical protein
MEHTSSPNFYCIIIYLCGVMYNYFLSLFFTNIFSITLKNSSKSFPSSLHFSEQNSYFEICCKLFQTLFNQNFLKWFLDLKPAWNRSCSNFHVKRKILIVKFYLYFDFAKKNVKHQKELYSVFFLGKKLLVWTNFKDCAEGPDFAHKF